MKKLIIALSIFSSIAGNCQSNQGEDMMFRKDVLRGIDLREKQNEPWMSVGHEIPTLLIEAVKSGRITAFTSDNLASGNLLSIESFLNRITIPNSNVVQDTAYMDEFEKQDYLESLANGGDAPMYYFGKDLYQMELKETLYFSGNSSEIRNKINSITIFLPAEHPDNAKGYQIPIATFDYNEVISVFNNDPKAIWYNPSNDSEHKSYGDAFDLRLFSSYLLKVSNPKDLYITEQYNGNQQEAIIQAQEQEFEFLEFETNLWEN